MSLSLSFFSFASNFPCKILWNNKDIDANICIFQIAFSQWRAGLWKKLFWDVFLRLASFIFMTFDMPNCPRFAGGIDSGNLGYKTHVSIDRWWKQHFAIFWRIYQEWSVPRNILSKYPHLNIPRREEPRINIAKIHDAEKLKTFKKENLQWLSWPISLTSLPPMNNEYLSRDLAKSQNK